MTFEKGSLCSREPLKKGAFEKGNLLEKGRSEIRKPLEKGSFGKDTLEKGKNKWLAGEVPDISKSLLWRQGF